MISAINLANILSRLPSDFVKTNEFNSSLPLMLKVMSRLDKAGNFYTVRLGNMLLETRSDRNLPVGSSYWANVGRGRDGDIVISNLVPQPRFLERIKSSKLKLDFDDLDRLFKTTKKEEAYRDFLLNSMPLANTKQDFLELSGALFGLQNGVVSVVVGEDEKESLLQIKEELTFIEFYGLFTHIGEISGVIYMDDLKSRTPSLRVSVMSDKVRDLLLDNIHSLKGFGKIDVDTSEIRPLWDLDRYEDEHILNLKA